MWTAPHTNPATAVHAQARPAQETTSAFWQQVAGRVSSQTAEGVRIALARDGHQARVQLQPESLGKLVIHVVMEGSRVQVHVTAEHASVGQIIAAQQAQLRETLAAQGLQITDLAVSVGLGANPQELPRQRELRQQQTRAGGSGREDTLEAVGPAPVQSPRRLREGSSIEYWI
jgi:flagellar hook-length control protein FliK